MRIKFISILFLINFFFFRCAKENDNLENNLEKQPLKGLVTMGSVRDLRNGNFNTLKEANIHPNIYSGVVIRTTWGVLEPERGVFDFSSIQEALGDIERYNNTHPSHKLGAKLRISATINPPNWVLTLENGPVEIVVNQYISYNIGLFWTEAYSEAWHELQVKLAEEFDNNNLIQEVCISSPTMATDEPLITIFNSITIENLQQKGFTDYAFKQALKGTIENYSCWQQTLIDFSFNTYRKIDTGVPINEDSFTIILMNLFKNKFEERAVLSNHGLQENLTSGALPIYQAFLELGGPIAAQTKAPSDLTDEIFELGLNYNILEFEIWDSLDAGGFANFTSNDLQRWKSIIDN